VRVEIAKAVEAEILLGVLEPEFPVAAEHLVEQEFAKRSDSLVRRCATTARENEHIVRAATHMGNGWSTERMMRHG
jgi:hypothetical protein